MSYRFVSAVVLLLVPAWVQAMVDLGVVGWVYPVVEPDIYQEASSKISRRWHELSAHINNQLNSYRSAELHFLPRANTGRRYLVDMTYTVEADLHDQAGRLVYPRGYRFNPLQYMTLSIGLVVIDGDDPSQLDWLMHSPYVEDHRVKILICRGDAGALSTRLGRAVYYLDREVAERLQLRAVPAVVVQKGTLLEVTEFKLMEK